MTIETFILEFTSLQLKFSETKCHELRDCIIYN